VIGIPSVLATRQDWLNTYQYVQASNNMELRKQFRERLTALKETRYMKVLKSGVEKEPEDQTPSDFEDVLDAASPFVRSGLLENEVDTMTGGLN
jgi:arginine deiminase